MTTSIPAVSGNKANVTSAEFVKLIIYNDYTPNATANIFVGQTYQIKTSGNTNWTNVGATSNVVGTIFTSTANNPGGTGTAWDIEYLTFSSAYQAETIGGNTYTPLGGLLSVGPQNRNLRVTSGDTTIAISGIDGNNMFEILNSDGQIRGSMIEVTRGFYNPANMTLTNAYVRFTGIITNYGITEDVDGDLASYGLTDTFTITLDASSYKTVLENRIAGRKTNKNSWQFFDTTDSSMNNVNSIAGFPFDFGQDPKTKTTLPGYGGGGIPGTGSGAGGGFSYPGKMQQN